MNTAMNSSSGSATQVMLFKLLDMSRTTDNSWFAAQGSLRVPLPAMAVYADRRFFRIIVTEASLPLLCGRKYALGCLRDFPPIP